MTSTFTSRFRRRNEGGAEQPLPAGEAVAAQTGAPPNAKIAEEKASDPVKVEGAAPETAKPEATPAAGVGVDSNAKAETKQALPPSRLVEVDKSKPQRAEATQAKPWLGNAQAYRIPAAAAAALILTLGTGYGIGKAGRPTDSAAMAKSAQMIEATAGDLREAHGQIGQLAAELKAVKSVVESMKTEREKARSEMLAKQAQLSDRLERSGQENATRIGRLAEQLDRIEKSQRDASRQAAAADKGPDKGDRPEKLATAPVPPTKPNLDVAHTGSIGEVKPAEKPDPRKTPLDGYVVRDYDEGYALIETRSGRYIDVAVGYTLPGVGKVEAIERRGRQWVVITPKGYIGER